MIKKLIIAAVMTVSPLVTANGSIPIAKADVPCDFCVINAVASAFGHAIKEYMWCSWAGCA